MIWSGALMLEFLGQGDERFTAAHDEIITAIEQVIASGDVTPDLGGKRSTQEVGAAIAGRVSAAQ
ncbi:Tartrate dehydrogenase Tartrate decarboxylase [Pseudomonas savastanoi]|nr:Tartrate dehydrogenase Tartrate decarboxylase [Pseudomonas savastanoi]